MSTTVESATVGSSIAVKVSESDEQFPVPPARLLRYATAYSPDAAPLATKWYARTHTIAGGATLTLDLVGSATLLDPFGNAVSLTKLHALRVRHAPASPASAVKLNGAAANSATDLVKTLKPNDSVLCDLPTGEALTGGAADLLVILNNDGAHAATVEVEVLGE